MISTSLCGIIFDLFDLDLALFIGSYHAIDQTAGGGAEWYFGNGQCLFITLHNLGTNTHPPATLTIIIGRASAIPPVGKSGNKLGLITL